uniref:Uncharacterized protein n=1 Tax=Cucumis melo TaxID=3656 RepID=A0A9I9E6Z7_CUCME
MLSCLRFPIKLINGLLNLPLRRALIPSVSNKTHQIAQDDNLVTFQYDLKTTRFNRLPDTRFLHREGTYKTLLKDNVELYNSCYDIVILFSKIGLRFVEVFLSFNLLASYVRIWLSTPEVSSPSFCASSDFGSRSMKEKISQAEHSLELACHSSSEIAITFQQHNFFGLLNIESDMWFNKFLQTTLLSFAYFSGSIVDTCFTWSTKTVGGPMDDSGSEISAEMVTGESKNRSMCVVMNHGPENNYGRPRIMEEGGKYLPSKEILTNNLLKMLFIANNKVTNSCTGKLNKKKISQAHKQTKTERKYMPAQNTRKQHILRSREKGNGREKGVRNQGDLVRSTKQAGYSRKCIISNDIKRKQKRDPYGSPRSLLVICQLPSALTSTSA